MSINKKYKKQFDSHAGSPAEFDSLFTFEGDKLTAKKKISMKKRKGYSAAAFTSVAAALVIFMAGLSYINSKSADDPGISELADMTSPALTDYIEEYSMDRSILLSELSDSFDYHISDKADVSLKRSAQPRNFDSIYGEAPVVIRGRVSDKVREGDTISYSISVEEIYSKNETVKLSYIGVSSDINLSYELQIGGEYILPIFDDSDSIGYDDSVGFTLLDYYPICKTKEGWLFTEENLIDGLSPINVINDTGNTASSAFYIEPNTSKVLDLLRNYFEISPNAYYHSSTTNTGYSVYGYDNISRILANYYDNGVFDCEIAGINSSSDILGNTEISVKYEDMTVIAPHISGTVIYAGNADSGKGIVTLLLNDGGMEYVTCFSGFTEIFVKQGDEYNYNDYDMIGTANNSPVNIRVYDMNGNPMIFSDAADSSSSDYGIFVSTSDIDTDSLIFSIISASERDTSLSDAVYINNTFTVETVSDGKWIKLFDITADASDTNDSWVDVGTETAFYKLNWSERFGALGSGNYRVCGYFCDSFDEEDNTASDVKALYSYFDIM